MAQPAKKSKIERDRFTDDGVRLFNPTKEHGTVYSDGFTEVKYIQEYEGREVSYRGDHAPVGYAKGVPMPKAPEELLTENQELHARIADLEASQKQTNELMARLLAQLEKPGPTAAPPASTQTEPVKPTPQQLEKDVQQGGARPQGKQPTGK